MFEQIKADIKRALKSKRENDPQRLLKLLRENPNEFLSAKGWAKIFDRPIPSTRRNLSGLEDNDVITRLGKKGARGVKYGFVVDDGVWYKKILKTGQTKNPLWKTSTNIEAVTYEPNDINRFQDMLNTIVDNIMEISYIDEAGYDYEPIGYDFIDEQAQYPRIKVTMFSAGGSTTKYIP